MPGAVTVGAWKVELAPEERRLLLELLADDLDELRVMLSRTERRDVRHDLLEREKALESLIAHFSGSRLPA